MPLTFNDVES